jgi:hypothetical protein
MTMSMPRVKNVGDPLLPFCNDIIQPLNERSHKKVNASEQLMKGLEIDVIKL